MYFALVPVESLLTLEQNILDELVCFYAFFSAVILTIIHFAGFVINSYQITKNSCDSIVSFLFQGKKKSKGRSL